MIRKMTTSEVDKVAQIWLKTNISAHCFISAEYWKGNFDMVKAMFLQAEIYVWENEGVIQGFVGLDGDYIAGIFVKEDAQFQGIGKELLDYVKTIRSRLTLRVYQKNMRAAKFYQRESFVVASEGVDEETGEKDYLMAWQETAK